MKIILVDIVDERLKLAEAFEPDVIINASHVDPVEEIRRITDGKGADVIITATPASIAVWYRLLRWLEKMGESSCSAVFRRKRVKPGVDINLVHYNALHLIGTTIFAPRHFQTALQISKFREDTG